MSVDNLFTDGAVATVTVAATPANPSPSHAECSDATCPVVAFVAWLYDESPVWPDDVPRERLLAAWRERATAESVEEATR